jgi:branched-chain amino acid transport system ATP-binding protein
MLSVEKIVSAYGNILALKGISLFVEEGKIVTLIGANGAGKTTLLKSISGLVKPVEGSIRFEGRDISKMEPHEIVKRGISMVPEGRRVFPRMSVLENLEMGAYLVRDKNVFQSGLEEVYKLFPKLKERTRQLAGTLSGGEQQMLAIGRALMSNPKLLLLDEPSMGLAPIIVEEIFAIIQDINKKGTTILLVEQNAHMALSIADTGYVLETGHVVLHDSASALLENDQVKKAYLGD